MPLNNNPPLKIEDQKGKNKSRRKSSLKPHVIDEE